MFRIFLFVLVFSCFHGLKAQSPVGHYPANTGVQVEMPENLRNLIYLYKEKAKKYPQIAGYRIQIFNGRKSDCLSQRGAFLRQFPEMQAYLLYEVPEYKTQVGNFRSRLEAERFLQQIIEAFPGSFVIATQIEYPKVE
jgi:hypothetical protein